MSNSSLMMTKSPTQGTDNKPPFYEINKKGDLTKFFFLSLFSGEMGLSHFLKSIDLFPFAFVLLRLSRQACGSSLGCYQISISIRSSKKEKLNLHKREDYGVGGFL